VRHRLNRGGNRRLNAILYRPAFTAAQIADCERLVRQHSAPQAVVYRAKLALLLHAEPALGNAAAGRRLGKHENWVRYWLRAWTTEGFRLGDKAGRERKPAFPRWRWPRLRRWPASCRRNAPRRSVAIAPRSWPA